MNPSHLRETDLLSQTFAAQAEFHASLASTQDHALQLSKNASTRVPAVVVAERQTAGRGRDGHSWWSPEGALLASVVVPVASPSPLLALAVGAAICDVVQTHLQKANHPKKARLKWPNDVFVADAKIAGTLIDVPHTRLAGVLAVIGIGLNVNNRSADAPSEISTCTISLSELTEDAHDLQAILIRLLNALEIRLGQLATDAPTLLADCNERCRLAGREITIRQAQRVFAGKCHGFAGDGGLLVQETGAEKPTPLYSGTVIDR